MSEESDVREHLLNLVNALANLSPSRSVISQLILLLPEDPAVIEHSYPEVISPDAKSILESLGVKFDDKVERIEKSFAEALYKHIHKTFDWLDDELLYMYGGLIGRYYVERLEKMGDVRSSLATVSYTHLTLPTN